MKSFLDKTWKFILLICSLTVIATWIAIPEHLNLNLILSGTWLLVAIVLMFPRRVQLFRYYTSRHFKALASNVVTLFLVACILGIVNFMVYQRPMTTDFTKQKVNTLSDQTVKLLKQIKGSLKIELYASKKMWPNSLSILELLRYYKNDIQIEAFDVEKQLIKAKAANITQDNSIRLIHGDRNVVTVLKSELSIINALIRVLREKPYLLGFTQNHGEISFEQQGNEGIQFLLSGLKVANNQYGEIDLTKPGRITQDAILMLGPKKDLSKQEIRKLEEYLLSGGKLFIAMDPGFEKDNLPALRAFLEEWGIKVGRDIIVDKMSTIEGVDASVVMSKKFHPNHQITKNFKGRVIFPLSSSIILLGKQGYKQDELVFSSGFPASWAESDLASLSKGKVVFEEGDVKGPVAMAAVMEKNLATDKRMRLAVFSTSRFLVDGYRNQSANYNLLMNSIAWLVEEDRVLSLNRPALVQERIFMSQTQLNLIFYFSIIFVPLLLLGLGTYTYRRKQRL